MYKDLDSILGNGEEIKKEYFQDGESREIYPIPLFLFSKFMGFLMKINLEFLWKNFLDGENCETGEAVMEIMQMSFANDDPMKFVNAKNYTYIISKITKLNGIDLSPVDETETDKKKE